jgi:alpha-ketoglutarate-dependent taurine dioxygenase
MASMEVQDALSVRGFADSVGAAVTGLSLANPLPEAAANGLREALLDHGVLVFRSAGLTPERLVGFARTFGELESFPPHPTQFAEHPEIVRLSNVEGLGYPTVGHHWHPDGHVRPEPTSVSLLYCVQPSRQGGETLFADSHRAYDTLPATSKRRLEGVRAQRENAVAHPLVRNHPVTGRPSLYLNAGRTARLLGTDTERPEELVAELVEHLERLDGIYRHRWSAGDLVVWDNAAILHRATPASADPRVVHRVEVKGRVRRSPRATASVTVSSSDPGRPAP